MSSIEYRAVETLIPYARNSRTHSDEQIAQIAASIKEFGWTNPVLIDGDNGLIAGHGRIMAARKLAIEEVPCIQLSHLTEAQKRALVIADNQLALNSGWDMEMLKVELQDLKSDDFDLGIIGFEAGFIDELLESVEPTTEGFTDEDDAPELPVVAKSKVGDVWKLGNHRLMCGDSTSEKDVAELLKPFVGKKIHCISDPPYGISYEPGSDKYGMIKNDDVFLDYIGLAKKYTNGFFFMWTSYQVVDEWIGRIKQEFDKITNMIVWHKGGGGLGDCQRTLSTDFEIALVVNRGNDIHGGRIGSMWDYEGNARREYVKNAKKEQLLHLVEKSLDGDTVWKVAKDSTAFYLHPTQKPVEVSQKALHHFTEKNDVVCDLFLGSGSNLIACETMGRVMAGMELDTKYCDVIIKRWQEFTGQQAIHSETGETFDEVM